MPPSGLRRIALTALATLLWAGLPGGPIGTSPGAWTWPSTGMPTGVQAGTLLGANPLELRSLAAEARNAARTGAVVGVSDGDTVVVRFGDQDERIRLLGIDTPERSQDPWGPKAARFLTGLVGGKTVRVETDVQTRDRYGRTLGYVFLGDTHVNLELVKQGYAMLYTSPPNVRYSAAFLAAQRQAREAGRNIWSPTDGLTETPYEYRHHKPAPRGIGQDGLPNHRGSSRSEAAKVDPAPAGRVHPAPSKPVGDSAIVGNRRSKKFHAATCPLADTIAPANRVGYGSAEEARAAGLVPCRSCGGKPR